MSLAIRPARLADALGIAVAHHAAVHAIDARFYEPALLDKWAPPVSLGRAETLYVEGQSTGELAFVAEMDAEIIGFAIAHLPSGELRALYVAPSGSGRGFGRALLTAVEDVARAAGCTHLDARASTNAEAFYRVHGFAVTGTGQSRFDDGSKMAVTFMRKPL